MNEAEKKARAFYDRRLKEDPTIGTIQLMVEFANWQAQSEVDYQKMFANCKLPDVSQRYTIEDIERCVENWGLCKVEKEYIERFLNGA